LLRKLLETQVAMAAEAPPGETDTLIHEAELHEIRRIWRTERGDWPDSVPRIVRETLKRDLDWVADDAVAFTAEDGQLLDDLCREQGVPT
ncbi:DNA phosphorothioation system sulfurtransferase DndC, partial [Klebsiella michiganensis]|nr:DNA phosphorothioation system sulfurtransferase DndC [Klebsiella michiganensis]